jgi:type II secretory pathway pseudopilin PulG
MFCQRCGNALAPGARFCNTCGTPVTAAAPISTARPTLVTVLAILHFVGGSLLLLGGTLGLIVSASETPSERAVSIVLAFVFLIFGAASLAAGIGLWKMREWGRVLQIVLACIGLLGLPLGTIISILLLVYFTRPHIKLLFSGKRLDQMTPDEVAVLATAGGQAASGASALVIALVAVFVVVGFIGILAAIAIPNLLTAMQRSRQMRTIADMNRIAQAVEAHRESHNAPPPSIAPTKDAWTNNLRYVTDGTNYWIVSAGKDGRFEEDDVSRYTKGATTNFDNDIVLENGEMLRWPQREGR